MKNQSIQTSFNIIPNTEIVKYGNLCKGLINNFKIFLKNVLTNPNW